MTNKEQIKLLREGYVRSCRDNLGHNHNYCSVLAAAAFPLPVEPRVIISDAGTRWRIKDGKVEYLPAGLYSSRDWRPSRFTVQDFIEFGALAAKPNTDSDC